MYIRKQFVLAVISVTLLFFACNQKPSEGLLPNELAGLKLVKVEKNEIAQNKLSKMHHGVDFANYESVIGTYLDKENFAMVYLTIFESEEKSAR